MDVIRWFSEIGLLDAAPMHGKGAILGRVLTDHSCIRFAHLVGKHRLSSADYVHGPASR